MLARFLRLTDWRKKGIRWVVKGNAAKVWLPIEPSPKQSPLH